MKKYENFLLENINENFVKILSLEDAMILFKLTPMYETIIEKGIIPGKKDLFYRIVKMNAWDEYDEYIENEYGDYNLVEPDSITRISPYSSNNLYNLILSNLNSWSKYPKRDNSFIGGNYQCIDNRGYDEDELMIVVPYGDEIAICPNRDIWVSFNETLRTNINNFVSILKRTIINYDIVVNDTDWNKFVENLIKFDEKRKNDDYWSKNVPDFKIQDKYKNILEKWKQSKITSLEFLEQILDPNKNNFQLIKFDGSKKYLGLISGKFFSKSAREIWTDDKSLLIRESEWNNFVEKVIQKYKK